MRRFSARRTAGAALALVVGLAAVGPGSATMPRWLSESGVDWPARAALPAGLAWVAEDVHRPGSQPAPGAVDVPAESLDAAERVRFDALQGLLERFHTRLVDTFGSRMDGIAQPRLQVVVAGRPYARARQLMVCVAFEHTRPHGRTETNDEHRWLGVNGHGIVFFARPENCAKRGIADVDIEALNFLFNRNNGSCPLMVSGDRPYEASLGPGCRDQRPDDAFIVDGLAFPAAANVVEITRMLLAESPSMEMLEAVVLHEAAHYYLAHPASWTANNAYFYFADELHLQPGPPPPAGHALQEAGRRLVRLARRGCSTDECRELRAQFSALGLERYTVEQAADEYTVRALLLMDRDPEALIEHIVERGAGKPGWSRADCRVHSSKRRSPAPEGWAKPHHDRCFRLYRIQRYIARLREQGGAR